MSALHNSGINDIFTILNSAWPVSLGGTGGTTSITSWDAITAKGTDIASASTIVLTTATGPRIDITGTVAITAVTLANGSMRIARATGIFVLTASATLIVNKSTSVNYTTAVGDLMIFTAEGAVTSVTVIGSSSSSNTTSNAPFTNFAIGTPTVAASALTIPFTGVDGNALSASNVAYINFRSATAGSGAIAQLALTALASLVISSGSTLGMTSGVAATLALAIFNDAGTARPAIINPLTLPLVDGIASATSEGGAGAADSAGVWYSNAAITSKAYTIVGYITVTEATAGTWATAPSVTKVDAAAAVSNALPPDFQKVLSIEASASSTINFDTSVGVVIAANYDYIIKLTNVKPSADCNIQLRYGTGVTPTYQNTTYTSIYITGNASAAAVATNTTTTGLIISNSSIGGASAGEQMSIEVRIDEPAANDYHMAYATDGTIANDGSIQVGSTAGRRTAQEVLTGLQVLPSTGNFTSGTFTLYRRKIR